MSPTTSASTDNGLTAKAEHSITTKTEDLPWSKSQFGKVVSCWPTQSTTMDWMNSPRIGFFPDKRSGKTVDGDGQYISEEYMSAIVNGPAQSLLPISVREKLESLPSWRCSGSSGDDVRQQKVRSEAEWLGKCQRVIEDVGHDLGVGWGVVSVDVLSKDTAMRFANADPGSSLHAPPTLSGAH
jgi:hypothetical protein